MKKLHVDDANSKKSQDAASHIAYSVFFSMPVK
jgi:hypothetical protein